MIIPHIFTICNFFITILIIIAKILKIIYNIKLYTAVKLYKFYKYFTRVSIIIF